MKDRRFAKNRIIGKRCVVPVYPGGIRDTVIADINSNYSIRWLERALRHILQYVPESAVSLFSTTFSNRVDSVINTKGWHVLRDLKKCGLTYNSKSLFPIIREEMLRVFKDKRFNRYKIYEKLLFHDGDLEYEAQRGYFLGMANHTVTLCNIVIHRMARNALAQGDKPFKLKAIFGNDDADIAFVGFKKGMKAIATEYLNLEQEIHAQLGNLVHYDKSKVTSFGLFYEQYDLKGWHHKEALVCNALACAYLAPNIRVAKHYIFSQSSRFRSKWAREQLLRLIHYWGGEAYRPEDEFMVHFEAGGWLDLRRRGLKTTLLDLEYLRTKYSDRIISYCVYLATKYLQAPRPIYKDHGVVDNYWYKGTSKKAHPMIQLWTLTDNDLIEYYKKLTTFQRNFSRRIQTFNALVRDRNIQSFDTVMREKISGGSWYMIPEYFTNIDQEEIFLFENVPVITEFNTPDDVIESLLKDEEIDLNHVWNPQILKNDLKYTVPMSLTMSCKAQWFSNSGALPVLEYHSRTGQYPNITLEQRREPDLFPAYREKHILLTSYFKYSGIEKYKEPDLQPEVEIPFIPRSVDNPMPELRQAAIEAGFNPQSIIPPNKEEIPVEKLDLLERLLNVNRTHEGLNFHVPRPDLNDLSEPSEDDEPQEFDLFD